MMTGASSLGDEAGIAARNMDIPLPPMNPEVARLRRQSAQRKYVKRLRTVRMLWGAAGLLLLVLVVEVVVALCFSPRFWITRITVTGGETLTAPEIIRLAAIPPETNFYRVGLAGVEERIRAREPRVAAVAVRRGAVGALLIEVKERVPLCRLGYANPPLYVDAQRVLFTRPKAPIPPVPVVEGVVQRAPRNAFGKVVEDQRAHRVVECLLAAHQVFVGDAALDITRVQVGDRGRMTLVLRQGLRLLIGEPRQFPEKFWIVQKTIVFASSKGYSLDKLDYIDARVPNRPAGLGAEFMPKNGQEATVP